MKRAMLALQRLLYGSGCCWEWCCCYCCTCIIELLHSLLRTTHNEWMDKRTGKIMHYIVWQAYMSVSFIMLGFFAHYRTNKMRFLNDACRLFFLYSINVMLLRMHFNNYSELLFYSAQFSVLLLFLETSFSILFSLSLSLPPVECSQAIFIFCSKQIMTIHVHGILRRIFSLLYKYVCVCAPLYARLRSSFAQEILFFENPKSNTFYKVHTIHELADRLTDRNSCFSNNTTRQVEKPELL